MMGSPVHRFLQKIFSHFFIYLEYILELIMDRICLKREQTRSITPLMRQKGSSVLLVAHKT